MSNQFHRVCTAALTAGVLLAALNLTLAFCSQALSPPPPESEDQIIWWFLRDGGVRAAITATQFADDDDLSLGDWIKPYSTTYEFNMGIVTTSLASEVHEGNWWTAPVLSGTLPIGTVDVIPDPTYPGEWYQVGFEEQDLAEALPSLQPGDKLLDCYVSECWFAIRGDTAIPLNDLAKARFPEPLTLSEYQQYVMSYACEPDHTCGGGGAAGLAHPQEQNGATNTLYLLAALGLVAVSSATYLGLRRRESATQ